MGSDESRTGTGPVSGGQLGPAATATTTGTTRRASISTTVPAPRWASAYWLAFLGLALAEVLALWVRQGRVLEEEAYVAAAAVVREAWESEDAVVIAPAWADPLLRLQLGDKMGVKVAARTDLAPFTRLWVLSFRGAQAPEAPHRAPDFHKVVEGITVDRYDLSPSPIIVDLADLLATASADMAPFNGPRTQCTFADRPVYGQRGGLFMNMGIPRQRFVCEAPGLSTWIGLTVIEDLELKPRRCIFQPALGPEPLGLTFHDVHLGQQLVLYAGLYYIDERDLTGVPITIRVLVDGQERAVLTHHDGDGMKRYEVDLKHKPNGAAPRARGEIRIEVSAPDGIRRSLCWAGTIRDGARREAP